MKKENRKTPKLRFPGFTVPWEQRKLSEITSLITKGTTPLDKSGVGKVNFIKVENLDSSSGEIISCSKITTAEHEGYLKRSRLQENDILFSIAGTLGRVGVVKSSILPANTNQALSIIRLKEGSVGYISTVLKGRAVEDYIRRNPTIGAQPNLSLEQVGSLEIPFPQLDEQIVIGDFFENLDNLIALHQRKLDDIKEYKRGMLQKMFPKKGETVPEIRFPGFTDDWEQRKLGEVFVERHVFSKITDEYPRLSFTIEEGVISPEDRKTNKRDFLIKDESNKNYLITEIGDIIYNPANVVFGAIHRNSFQKGCLSPIYRIFTTQQNSRFMECVVRSPSFVSKLAQRTEGSVIKLKTLKPEAFLSMEVAIPPTIEEQNIIANHMCSLDNLITLHQRKIDELKEYKKGLLQQMFV